MIAPLRRRHRRTTGTLAVVLPVLYVLALAVRPAPPEAAPAFVAVDGAVRLEGSLGASAWLEDGRLVVLPDAGAREADALLYWSAQDADALPDDALLLGPLDGDALRAFPAPPAPGGALFVYGLAHARVVSTGPAPAR